MRYQTVKKLLALSLTGVLAMTTPVSLYATETESSAEAVSVEPEDFVLKSADKDITVKNGSLAVVNAELVQAGKTGDSGAGQENEKETDQEKTGQEETEGGTEGSTESSEEVWNLVLAEADGMVHTFEDVETDLWMEPELISEYGWLYIRYQDESGNSREIAETGEEKEYEEPVDMWVTTDVNVRKEASSDSETVCVSSLGSELEAYGIDSGWVKVKGDDFEGYIYHRYLTADEEEAEAAVQAEDNARAAAEAAAAAAQAQAQAAAQAQSKKSSGKKVVSRQAYDDCDGSGHGYYEIVYSDGSVAYENY